MQQNTEKEIKLTLVIVEGRSDLLFLKFLFKNFLNINLEEKLFNKEEYLYHEDQKIFVMQIKGFQKKEKVRDDILLNIQDILTIFPKKNLTFDLNLIIDTDDNLTTKQDKVDDIFQELKKSQLNIDKTEYFLLPGAKKNGQLEDLIYESLSTLLTPDFKCFDNFIECMNQPSIKPLHNKNDNFFSKLKLECYFAFFANKDNDTSCDIAKKLKFIEEKFTSNNKEKVGQIYSELILAISTFITNDKH